MAKGFSGGCLCGQVRFDVAQVLRVHFCHCGMCRRATGSAFAVLAWVRRGDLAWSGAERPRQRRSSPLAQRSFCGACGTPLTLVYDGGAAEIAIHTGAFDEPDSRSPSYHYGVEGRLTWVDCGVGLPEKATDLQPAPSGA